MSVRFVVLAGVVAFSSLPVNAAELIVNGGFETGNFTGWTRSGALGNTFVTAAAAATGNYGASFSPNLVGSISQSFATVVGNAYSLHFDLAHNIGTASATNSFGFDFNGVPVQGFGNYQALPYTSLTYTLVATSAISELKFNFRDGRPTSFSFDNVSLTGDVPEPAAWALMIAGFGFTGTAMRRRRVLLAV